MRVQIPEALGFLFDPPLGSTRYRVPYGGRGAAKSWGIGRALLVHGYANPLRILCAREFQSSIAESVHRLLRDQIVALGMSRVYTVRKAAITGVNGTEFIFKGLRRDPQGIKSTEGIDVAWVEEAHSVSKESWQVLIPTVRKPGSEIWASFNPDLETDETYQRFVTDPPTNAIVRKVTYKDNPFCPQVSRDDAAELLRRDPEAYAHVWGGEPWRRSDAEVLGGRYRVDEFEPGESWLGPYYGADWGFARDPSVLVRLWIHDSRLFIEYEAGGVQLDNDETARRFKEIPGADEHVIRADSARPETINEMCKRDLAVVAAPKWAGSVEDGIQYLRSFDEIIIHPRCPRAIQEARLWRYKRDPRTGDVLPQLMKSNDHTWDATRYGLAPMIRTPVSKKEIRVR